MAAKTVFGERLNKKNLSPYIMGLPTVPGVPAPAQNPSTPTTMNAGVGGALGIPGSGGGRLSPAGGGAGPGGTAAPSAIPSGGGGQGGGSMVSGIPGGGGGQGGGPAPSGVSSGGGGQGGYVPASQTSTPVGPQGGSTTPRPNAQSPGGVPGGSSATGTGTGRPGTVLTKAELEQRWQLCEKIPISVRIRIPCCRPPFTGACEAE